MEETPKFDLEKDILTTDWIVKKARKNEYYAQNIYAALCNMQWQKLSPFPILKEEYWTSSWRHAGNIIAKVLGKGDYLDWYCSGIRDADYNEEINKQWDQRHYVSEGTVTDEVRADFREIGWVSVPYEVDK